jgi:hypothetical protein
MSRPLHIPLIRALDLRWPDKYMRPSDRDPEDAYRAEQRLERRRVAAKLSPRTHDEILARSGRHFQGISEGATAKGHEFDITKFWPVQSSSRLPPLTHDQGERG